jgi:S-adenosylmethionine:tRNA ribosyltransferase-isomerase
MYRLSDFDFYLPPELIAQHPASERSASRLLRVDPSAPGDMFEDRQFKELIDLVNSGDVLVFNNSKVIPARLHGTKETGGAVEILVERIVSTHEAMVLLRVSKKPAAGSIIRLVDGTATDLKGYATESSTSARERNTPTITVLGRDPDHDDRFRLAFDQPVLDVLYAYGEIPLPPYIEHKPNEEDVTRYQTVYAATPGSVAAPTAGLHFDESVLKALDAKGVKRAFVTLHVGTGTFAPVRNENLEEHRMHSEWCEISADTAATIKQAREQGKRVIAVGTTSLRTLESGAIGGGLVKTGAWDTDIFIRPGYSFQVVDCLVTNFHLPKSTLLMLVSAFVGYDTMRTAYAHAIDQRYRFFSYGDAMFCKRRDEI